MSSEPAPGSNAAQVTERLEGDSSMARDFVRWLDAGLAFSRVTRRRCTARGDVPTGPPELTTLLGVRDRALLEVLYSTGIRRLELIHLTRPDLDPVRGVCFVREGKGQKDRVVPIGQRALDWIERYLITARPQLVVPPDDGVLFLTVRGRPLAANRLSELVHRYVTAAGLRHKGSCHVFRHTLATLLLQGGADIRHIQAILGHADLRTTARYTHVVIDELKAAHRRAHPAERLPQPPSL